MMTHTKTLAPDLCRAESRDGAESITISTADLDLMRDTIDPRGWSTDSYMQGTRAVNLFHEHRSLPVAKTTDLVNDGKALRASFKWLPGTEQIQAIYREGVLAASVEFISQESAPNGAGGLHFSKQTLTGWALTPNPANPRCLAVLKSLDGWHERGKTSCPRGVDCPLKPTSAVENCASKVCPFDQHAHALDFDVTTEDLHAALAEAQPSIRAMATREAHVLHEAVTHGIDPDDVRFVFETLEQADLRGCVTRAMHAHFGTLDG